MAPRRERDRDGAFDTDTPLPGVSGRETPSQIPHFRGCLAFPKLAFTTCCTCARWFRPGHPRGGGVPLPDTPTCGVSGCYCHLVVYTTWQHVGGKMCRRRGWRRDPGRAATGQGSRPAPRRRRLGSSGAQPSSSVSRRPMRRRMGVHATAGNPAERIRSRRARPKPRRRDHPGGWVKKHNGQRSEAARGRVAGRAHNRPRTEPSGRGRRASLEKVQIPLAVGYLC